VHPSSVRVVAQSVACILNHVLPRRFGPRDLHANVTRILEHLQGGPLTDLGLIEEPWRVENGWGVPPDRCRAPTG